MNANFISGQLRLLGDNLIEARRALKGGSEDITKSWAENSADEQVSLHVSLTFPYIESIYLITNHD